MTSRAFIQQPYMHVAGGVTYDQLAAAGVLAFGQDRAEGRGIEGNAEIKAGRGRREDQRAWRMLGKPEDRLVGGGNVRIVDKTATPICGRGSTGLRPDR